MIEGKSRSFVQGLIDEKKVKANNKVIKSNYKLKKGDFIEVEVQNLSSLMSLQKK